MTKLLHVFTGLLLGLMCITQQAQAYSDKQVFIPIANGDTTIIIPLLGTPSPSVTTQSNSLGSVYAMSWSAISGASYYEILLIENGEVFETIRVTDTSYNLSIPPGTFDARIMACNTEDKCGAAMLIGTYSASERARFAHADILGSPILETDIAGNVHREYHYQPFGDTREEKSEDIGYTGHLEDTDLDLTYMQARYYDPVLGRFYANDPVDAATFVVKGNVHGMSRYAYANNNPYKYIDPDGRNPRMDRRSKVLVEALGEVAKRSLGKNHTVTKTLTETSARIEKSNADLKKALGQVGSGTKSGDNLVYRGGSGTPTNLTPRAKDTTGLSGNVKPMPGKNQVVDTTKLVKLCAVCDNAKTGHVSIKPKDMTQMQGWIDSRGSGNTHPLTKELMDAVVDQVKK